MKIETKPDDRAAGTWQLVIDGVPRITQESYQVVQNVADMVRTRRADTSECGEVAAGILAPVIRGG